MSDEQKEDGPDCKPWAVLTFLVVFFVSMVFFFCLSSGIQDATGYPGDCRTLRRIDYIFPAHRVGCWLGEVIVPDPLGEKR